MGRRLDNIRLLMARALAGGDWIRLPGAVAPGAGGIFTGWSNLGSRAKQIRAYQGWVSSCTDLIGGTVSSLPVRLYKQRGARNVWPEIFDHPLLRLLDRPNPLMSGRAFRRTLQAHLDLTGMAFAEIVFNRLGRPAELWPLLPSNLVEIIGGDTTEGIVKGFRFRGADGRQVDLEWGRVLYLRYPHPESLLYGASPIQAQAHAVDTDAAIRVYGRNFFQNSARPDLVITTDQRLSDADARRILARWRAKYQGVEHSHEPALLDSGTRATPFSTSAKDFEFAAQAGWTRDNILAAYGVPAAKLGLVEDVNRANGQEVDRSYHEVCIGPRAALWTEELTFQVARLYDDALWCELDHEVPRDREFEHQRDMERLDRGYTTINELRAEDGLPDLPGGDVARVAANMLPLTATLAVGDPGAGAQRLAAGPEVIKDARQDLAESLEFIAALEPWERRMKSALRGVFGRQALEVLRRAEALWPRVEGATAGMAPAKAAKAGGPIFEPVFADWSQWADELRAAAWEGILPAVLEGAGAEALAAVGAGMAFNTGAAPVVAWLRESGLTAAQVNDFTRDRLRRELAAGLEAGEGWELIRDRVRAVFGWCETDRADTIARTEIANARRFGYHAGIMQTGAPFLKSWIAEPGARQTHAAASATYRGAGAIPADRKFRVGACAADVPGHSGCAGEDINCRCHVRYSPDLGQRAAAQPGFAPRAIVRAYTLEECRG